MLLAVSTWLVLWLACTRPLHECVTEHLYAHRASQQPPLMSVAQALDAGEPGWEFEPREFTPDADGPAVFETPEWPAGVDSFAETQQDEDEREDDVAALQDASAAQQTGSDPRERNHFFNPNNVSLRQYISDPSNQQQVDPNKCTQFRVDIREAIVCDATRCDKLDFEWPKADNQLVVIETTKHGMRFHQSNYAFKPCDHMARANKPAVKVSKQRDKGFDLFELFKPKPSARPTTRPAPDIMPPSPPAPTAAPNADGELSVGPIEDANTTQLVTTFRLDTSRRRQTMLGFGGALSDAACRNIKSLSPFMARSLMEDYYGQRGIRYNIVRMTMGSSDFSTTPYTNNDKPYKITPPATQSSYMRRAAAPLANATRLTRQSSNVVDEGDDVEMRYWHLTEEDYDYKLPLARQAIATSRQELRFFSSLWSPPIWMKNNSHIVHGFLKGDVYGPYYKALAELIVRWFEAYRRQGIEFWATTAMNEPVTGVKPFISHNSLGIDRDDYVLFYKLYLGPMLQQRGFGQLKLMMLDDNKGYIPNWVGAMFSDPEASKYIAGVGIHWYMNDAYENLDYITKHYPDKFIVSTEACNGFLPFTVHAMPGDWDRGVSYMYDIIKTTQHGSGAWVDWNMALDLGGGPTWANNLLDAAIIVNAERDEYYKSPMYYAMGHFSRFVERDATRLDYRIANARYDQPLEAVGFHSPNRNYIVIVALNANRHPVPFRIIVDNHTIKTVTLRADSFSTIIFKWYGRSRRHHSGSSG